MPFRKNKERPLNICLRYAHRREGNRMLTLARRRGYRFGQNAGTCFGRDLCWRDAAALFNFRNIDSVTMERRMGLLH